VAPQLAELLRKEQVDTFVHLGFKSEPSANREADTDHDVTSSLEVLDACAESPVSRLIIPSTTMCYGARLENPHQLLEDVTLHGHPAAHWVSNRVRVEQAVSRFRESNPQCDVTLLRHCWIMGPRYVDPFVRYFDSDWVPTLLGYDPLFQFVHEDDFLAVLEASVLEAHPGVFNVVGDGVLPLSGYLRLAGKRRFALPKTLLSAVTGSPVALSASDTADGFYDYLKYMWVASGDRVRQEFGPLTYSSQEAWSAMVTSRRLRRYR
jgi:UDP-glucose 4-epimerase